MENNNFDSKSIIELRKRARMSRNRMSKYLGVAEMTIYRWEKGESRPSLLALRQLHRLDKKVRG